MNNQAADHTADLEALVAGDVVYVLGQAGHIEMTLTADAPAAVAGVVTLTGTVATDGVAPSASDAVEVRTVVAPSPPPAPGPTLVPAPDTGWTKAEIVAWLNAHGDPAQPSLTKDELLDHVADILDVP